MERAADKNLRRDPKLLGQPLEHKRNRFLNTLVFIATRLWGIKLIDCQRSLKDVCTYSFNEIVAEMFLRRDPKLLGPMLEYKQILMYFKQQNFKV